MTTREAVGLLGAGADPGGAFDTELIARLANELYADGAPSAVQQPGFNQGLGLPETPRAPSPEAAPALGYGQPPVHPREPVAPPTAPETGGLHPPRSLGDLYPSFTKDHPRANGFLNAFAPGLLGETRLSAAAPDAVPPEIVPSERQASDRRLRVVDIPGGHEPFGADYYFLKPEAGRGVTPAYARAKDTPHPSAAGNPIAFDVSAVRRDFPALHQKINGHPLVWLDNAATTHKPQSVIDATSDYYSRDNSNIHRGAHTLATRSTDLFEGGRDKVRDFLGAASSEEIVFLRGTTEGVNLVANSFGSRVGAGDEIIVSQIEHHANIVPWQLLAERTGATLRVIPVNDRGELILEQFAGLLSGRTKIVSVTHVANALGTVNPVAEIIALSHAHGVPVLIDAAQSAPHIPLNVQALDADFLVFSGHKVFGPTGVGALYGKKAWLEQLPPWQGGGHMIEDVTFARTVYKGPPDKFEAGTPEIAGAVGLGAAIDYLTSVGLPAIAAYEHGLLEYAEGLLSEVRGVRILGTAREKASVLSFKVAGVDDEAVAKHLDGYGVAVRSGHHCALPALRRFGVDRSVRASLAFYNTREDVDVFIDALRKLPRR